MFQDSSTLSPSPSLGAQYLPALRFVEWGKRQSETERADKKHHSQPGQEMWSLELPFDAVPEMQLFLQHYRLARQAGLSSPQRGRSSVLSM